MRAVYLARGEVTQGQCRAAWADAPTPCFHPDGPGRFDLPAGVTDTSALPMDLSCRAALEVCRRLTDRADAGRDGYHFRLPWADELAAAAGTVGRLTDADGVFAGGGFRGGPAGPAVVGGRRPLHGDWFDLFGNVAEWVADPDPAGKATAVGGSYLDGPPVGGQQRPHTYRPDDGRCHLGLRPACDLVAAR